MDEPDFLDLAVLIKLENGTTLEKLSGITNSSIFDASNIAGSLKQKNLIDFTTYFPGPNTIIVTQNGKDFIDEANKKAQEQLDSLDNEILRNLLNGKRSYRDINDSLNIRPRDLATHLFKLIQQGYLVYELRSGNAYLLLTDKGFNLAKTEESKKETKVLEEKVNEELKELKEETTKKENNSINEIVNDIKISNKKQRNGLIITLAMLIVLLIVLIMIYIGA